MLKGKYIRGKKPGRTKPVYAGGPYTKGVCGNLNGRPKGSQNKYNISEFWKQLGIVEKKKDKSLLRHFIERAYQEDQVLIAVMKKMLPDLKAIEGLLGTYDASMTDEMANLIRQKLLDRLQS